MPKRTFAQGPLTIAEALAEATQKLSQYGAPTAMQDAKILLRHATGLPAAGLISNNAGQLDAAALANFFSMIEKRCEGMPVHRIIGYRSFFGRDFSLSPDTLEPRPDTEILVEAALSRMPDEPLLFLDIGTGTGCIAVTLACERQKARGVATDLSGPALATALENAERNFVADRLTFTRSDLFNEVEGRFDLIVSNPPYIPLADIEALAPEVRDHDPVLALDGGEDGLDIYRRILSSGRAHLNPGGKLLLELGADQCRDIKQIARDTGWMVDEVFPDLAGIERVICLS